MKHVTLGLRFLFCMQFLSVSLLAQKHFKLTVQLPQAINPAKVQAWLDDGKDVKEIRPQAVTGKQMILTGEYYSTYAVITLQHPPDSLTNGFAKDFFVGEKPATIAFNNTHAKDSTFTNYSLLNVLDFDKEKKQIEDYTANERNAAVAYEKQYGNQIFGGSDTSISNYYNKAERPALARKIMEYIKKHPMSYYSFYAFRTDVARLNATSPDLLLAVFNAFPDTFKYSDEGNYLNASLQGRLAQQNSTAPNFVAKDINKNTITLSEFKGKKTVLLHFWATWCTPCMRELPALKEIADQYKEGDLQIISLALPSSKYVDYQAVITKFQMNWTHVYNDPDLQNKYGNQPIPRICLIDKTGNLIYDNIGLGKNDDVELKELKAKMQEIISN